MRYNKRHAAIALIKAGRLDQAKRALARSPRTKTAGAIAKRIQKMLDVKGWGRELSVLDRVLDLEDIKISQNLTGTIIFDVPAEKKDAVKDIFRKKWGVIEHGVAYHSKVVNGERWEASFMKGHEKGSLSVIMKIHPQDGGEALLKSIYRMWRVIDPKLDKLRADIMKRIVAMAEKHNVSTDVVLSYVLTNAENEKLIFELLATDD